MPFAPTHPWVERACAHVGFLSPPHTILEEVETTSIFKYNCPWGGLKVPTHRLLLTHEWAFEISSWEFQKFYWTKRIYSNSRWLDSHYIFLQFTLLEKIDTTYHKKTFYRMLPLKTITSMMYFFFKIVIHWINNINKNVNEWSSPKENIKDCQKEAIESPWVNNQLTQGRMRRYMYLSYHGLFT